MSARARRWLLLTLVAAGAALGLMAATGAPVGSGTAGAADTATLAQLEAQRPAAEALTVSAAFTETAGMLAGLPLFGPAFYDLFLPFSAR